MSRRPARLGRLGTVIATIIAAVAVVPAAAASAAPEPPAPVAAPEVVERELYVMGTRARITVAAADRAAALAAGERAARALEAAEARLSTWTDASELARLNRAAVGEPVDLSPELAAELAAADACRRATDGAFDPGVGALVAAWGLREGGRLPAPAELAAALAAGGMDGFELLPGQARAVRRRAGVLLEEGAFGKGAGLDAALAAAVDGAGGDESLAIEIDLGGQLAWRASAGHPPAAAVAIADPRERSRTVALLDLGELGRDAGGSVATSGNGERGLVVDGRRLGHLLDPRTGRPAPDFGSLSVWAPTALEADCLATGLYVLGPRAALERAAADPRIEVVIVRAAAVDAASAPDRVEVVASPGLADRLRPAPAAAGDSIEITMWNEDGSRTLGRLGGVRVPAPGDQDAEGGAATPHPHDPEREYTCRR